MNPYFLFLCYGPGNWISQIGCLLGSNRRISSATLMFASFLCLSLVTRSYLAELIPVARLASSTCVSLALHHRRRKSKGGKHSAGAGAERVASYSRFSSDLQHHESNADQQRKCREKAATNEHQISPTLEFTDEAISGTKRNRVGLNALIAAAEDGKIDVLYFYSLSRLSRESVITLPLLKNLVYNWGVRVVSVTEGIDSDETAWELIAHIMSIVHEQYVKDLADSVFRGQEGVVLSEDGIGKSLGDHCFGYETIPVPSSEPVQRSRQSKPRKMYVINPETSAWVARIYHWFVKERRSLRWITRELNRLGAPKDHRATTALWRHQYLPRLLRNGKYIGRWTWGEKQNIRDPLTGKIQQEDRNPDECEQWVRHLPHLRIVDDEIFEEAQRLLAANVKAYTANRKKKGRFNGSRPGTSSNHPRHLLSQLIVCSQCENTFSVGGAHGKYLFCPGYATGKCPCQTQLRRDRAERMILSKIGQRILGNPHWRQQVLDETLKAWKAQEATLPTELNAARRNLSEVEQKIEKLLDRIESGQGGPELDTRLSQRRMEKRDLTERVSRLDLANQDRRPQPTKVWIDEQLSKLGEVLLERTPAAAHALRDLVGGAIVVTEIRESDQKRFHLQGKFLISSQSIVSGLIGPNSATKESSAQNANSLSEEIVIEFRDAPEIEALSEQAKELYDQGLMNAEIAERLQCCRSRVTLALKYWFESRGLEKPDGRSRRSTLQKKHLEPPLYQTITDEVMDLYSQKRLLKDIARQLQVDHNTITASIRWWHEERGLPVPDGRTRRKELDEKNSSNSPDEPIAE